MATTYVDVTRVLTWQGRYTGMERIAYELTKLLQAESDIKLCCFTPSSGFVDISGRYAFNDGVLTSDVVESGPGLRHLLKTDKKAFVKHAIKRKISETKQKGLEPIEQGKDNTLLVFDGLWDRQNYTDEVVRLASEGMRLAHLVHDVVPLVMPQVCFEYVTIAYGGYFDRIAPLIDVLFSTSKSTEKDFTAWYGEKLKPKIRKVVIRYADEFQHNQPVMPTDIEGIEENFILAVSTIEVRKNYQLLYQVYRLAFERGIKLPNLIIVGRDGWLAESFVQAVKNDPKVKNKITLVGPVNDAGLSWLYGNCLFTVFPSLYEGWGLPVAESLFFGKVCAASSSSSIPEIGGNINVYFSPYSTDECLKTVVSLMDAKVRRGHEETIAKKYKITTWLDTAEEIKSNL